MSEGTEAVEQWDADREWHPDDERWGEQPKPPADDREASVAYDRSKCPLMPLMDYVILRVDKIDFMSASGIAVAADADGTGVGAHAPILTVIRAGPDVTMYKPGDYVLTNPRNNELALEWADPRPPHVSRTFIMMKEKVIIARYDRDIIEQMKARARYCDRLQKQRAETEAKEKAFRESNLNPNKAQEVLDATGQPVTKSGMQEEVLPEGLTPPT